VGDAELSIVVPVFNEAGVLPELARRCVEAARATGMVFELLLVDDASTDGTGELARQMAPPIHPIRLPQNLGQLGATLHGLGVPQGRIRVVLDGDLQDPPELIPELVAALAGGDDVAFAVKARRSDPLWFRVGRVGYGLLSRVPGSRAAPSGAGSYCALRSELAEEIADMSCRWGNLASLVALSRPSHRLVRYDKQERLEGNSRVGFFGLVREALWSLSLSGALAAWSFWIGGALAGLGLLLPTTSGTLLLAAAAALCVALLLRFWTHRLRQRREEPRS